MSQAETPPANTSDRAALRRRVRQMYAWLNAGAWERCFSLIDPRLRQQSQVEAQTYADSLREFREAYGKVEPWYVRISLHLDASRNKLDGRPFAFVYVVWQDQSHGFHMFRERWVRDGGHWYTRVVGLVPNRDEAAAAQD